MNIWKNLSDEKRLYHYLFKLWLFIFLGSIILFVLFAIASVGHSSLFLGERATYDEENVTIDPPIPCLSIKEESENAPYIAIKFMGCYNDLKINGVFMDSGFYFLDYKRGLASTTINNITFIAKEDILEIPVEYNSQISKIRIPIRILPSDFLFWVLYFMPAIIISMIVTIFHILLKKQKRI